MVDRLSRVYEYLVDFWSAAQRGRGMLEVDQQFLVGTSTQVTVVETSPEMLVIRTEFGQQKRYTTTTQISSGVAIALAEMALDPNESATHLAIGAFVAVDPLANDLEEARRYWSQAQALGADTSSLLPVLDDNYDLGGGIPPIPGLDPDESERLLDDLVEFACQPPRVYHHTWREGDAVIWDNRCLLHRARPWDHSELRRMKHTRIAGDPRSEGVAA